MSMGLTLHTQPAATGHASAAWTTLVAVYPPVDCYGI
jgi:hypothetical protein